MRLKLTLVFSLLFFLIHSLTAQDNLTSSVESGGEVLIDFSTLIEEISPETEIDFSDLSSLYGLPDEEKEKMKIDLSWRNWQLFIPPSILPFFNKNPSYIAPAQVKDSSPLFDGESILGMRLFFPVGKEETYTLYPPFPIPFEEGEKGSQFLNKGVIKNVGVIKEIQIDIYSENAGVKVSLNLENSKGKTLSIPFGNLNFWGWRRLIWLNPSYSKNLNYLKSKLQDTYGEDYRFKSLSFTHPSSSTKSDALLFIRSIKVIYDKGAEDISLEVGNNIILEEDQDSLEEFNIPYYKRYIIENYLDKKKSSVLKNNDSFVNKENS